MLESKLLSDMFLRRYELNRSKTQYKIIKSVFRLDIPETLRFKHYPNNILFIFCKYPSGNESILLRFEMNELTKMYYCESPIWWRGTINKKVLILIKITEDEQELHLYWFNNVPPKKQRKQFIENFGKAINEPLEGKK